MELKKDIERAIRHITAKDYKNPKTETELQTILNDVINCLMNI